MENSQAEAIESGLQIDKNVEVDEDGRSRTGTVWSASAHIITAVIGSGVLSLAWGMAQLGWVAGVATLVIFSAITLYTSNLLADAYRSPLTGFRNPTYTEVIKNNLGVMMYTVCATTQGVLLFGLLVGYTITAGISSVTIQKSYCSHIMNRGKGSPCREAYNQFTIGMGILELFLSQIPNFDKLWFLSIIAAVMSFAYASIGAGLSLAKLVSGQIGKTSLTGVEIATGAATDKMWSVFRAFGCIAFAYNYSIILIEIEDTLKPEPPENKVMKKANTVGVMITTAFYMMTGCFGYAAFGNSAPGNLLTGFESFGPFWLVDLANIAVVVHLVGAFQVCGQPLFNVVEIWSRRKFPKSKLVTGEYNISICKHKLSVNLFRLAWRSLFVTFTTLLALIIPFFNDVMAFLGAIGYWPMTVYFPIELHITRNKIGRWTRRWIGLQLINTLCLLVAVAAACGAVEGLIKGLKTFRPFKFSDEG